MRLRLAGLGALIALAGVAVYAATGFGSGTGREGPPDATPISVKTHRVNAPSSAAAKALTAKARRHRTKVIFKETGSKPVTFNDAEVTIGACPKGSAAVNGYYIPDQSQVFLEGMFPSRNVRKWKLDLHGAAPYHAVLGIVCVKP